MNAPADRLPRWIAPALIGVSSAVLAVRLFRFIRTYAVNVLFWDQWDFWNGLFTPHSWWDLFSWQHGPHREGLGYAVIQLTALASDWDLKTEAYVIGVIFILSTALALALKWLLTGRWSVFDVTIPLIVLTLANYEAYVGTTNPAHGPVPLFLVLCLALLRFLPNTALRVALTLFVNFLLVYTGFGVFFGLVVFLLMLVDLAASVRAREGIVRHLVGAAGSAATLLLFFRWHYSFQPAVGCFVFPDPHPIRYGEYISTLYLRAFQLHDLAPRGALVGAGVLVTAASAAVLLWATWRTLRSWGSSRVHVVAFALSAFCLLFAANTAIGRVCLGVEQAASSRYVSYSLLSVLAMYYALQTAQLRPWLRTGLLSVLLVLCLVKESRSDHDLPVVRSYSEGKARWAACYLREENVSSCNQSAKFSVYPEGQETHLEEKLRYLKERHLNLFKGTR